MNSDVGSNFILHTLRIQFLVFSWLIQTISCAYTSGCAQGAQPSLLDSRNIYGCVGGGTQCSSTVLATVMLPRDSHCTLFFWNSCCHLSFLFYSHFIPFIPSILFSYFLPCLYSLLTLYHAFDKYCVFNIVQQCMTAREFMNGWCL